MLDNPRSFSHDVLGMDIHRLTRSYLETLSTGDLAALAAELSLDLPPDLDRIFVIEEILDSVQEEEDPREEPELVPDASSEGPVHPVIPQSYSTTFLEVLIRDSVWAFAFWEIKSQDREFYERSPDFGGYRLRVSSIGSNHGSAGESFYIGLDKSDNAWYVCFPSPKGWFKVELCALKNQKEHVLACSQPFRIPFCGDTVLVDRDEHPLYPILSLSGIEEFQILSCEDRASHILQRCEF